MRDRDLVNLQDLSYRSMLPLLKANAPDRVEESILNGERVQVARVADLLYLPDRGLQILEGRIIPREAFPDPGIVIQAKLARIQDDRPTVYRSSDFDYRDDEVCILSNSWAKSFYHWTEELYKVVILEHLGFSGKYVVSRMPAFATEFLELLRIPPERILLDVPRPTIFRSAVLTTMVWHVEAKSHRGVFFALRDAIFSGDVSQEPSRGERLWILRGRQFAQRRDTLNAEEVQGLLERHGFTCIDMSELPVRRKIGVVQNAKVLGGPHGGGLALSMFLKQGSTVIECFSPHHINICFIGICHNLNHKYHQIVFRNTVVTQHPYGLHSAIDCDHLQLVLQNLEPPLFPVRPTASRPDLGSRRAYETALLAHTDRIAPELALLDSRIEGAQSDEHGEALRILRTMRLILCSGLFDADRYLAAYPDIRDAGVDPLEHYVTYGDRENRKPHPYFDPLFYRLANPGVPPDQNALGHYIEEGERAGLMPNWNFDPAAYLAANPELSHYVNRPLFHYLKIGKPGGMGQIQPDRCRGRFASVTTKPWKIQDA